MTIELEAAPDLTARPSADLRRRLSELETTRARAIEDLAEKRVLRDIAARELADLEDRVVRGRETGLDKEITKAEAKVVEIDREMRMFTTARDRTLEETQAEVDALTAAIPLAELRERREACEAEIERAHAFEHALTLQFTRGLALALEAFARMSEHRRIWPGMQERAKSVGLSCSSHVDAPFVGSAFDHRGLELVVPRLPQVEGISFARSGDVPPPYWTAEVAK